LRNRAFPGWAKKAERTSILEQIRARVEALPEMQDSFAEGLQDLAALDKQVLVERHLISREHAAKGAGSAVVVNRRQTLSVMINEEDHLRMQSIRSGLQLKQAFKLVDKIDTALESKLDFAFDPRLGYLTACPTNVGTGMRASAMLHLPGLVLSELINQVIQAVSKIGLAVRGLYGEGTEAMGNLFQISNQTTLGEKEEDIINNLLWRYYTDEQIRAIEKQIISNQTPESTAVVWKWMIRGLSNAEIISWLRAVEKNAPQVVFKNLFLTAEKELPGNRFRQVIDELQKAA
jgi:protein arginine kinase